jgi:hypothetical protein
LLGGTLCLVGICGSGFVRMYPSGRIPTSSVRVFLRSMKLSTAAAKIPDWRTQIRGVWLIKIGDTIISSVQDASSTLKTVVNSGAQSVTLLFSHPEIRPNLSCNGLPIVSSAPFRQHVHDQLNNRWEFTTCEHIPTWISLSGDLAFSHQDGIYGFKFPKRFSELSQEKTSLYSPLLALFTLLTLIN